MNVLGIKSSPTNLIRSSGTRNQKTIICVIAEGETELDYLKYLKNNNRFDNTILDLHLIDKPVLERDVSDRMNLVNYMYNWRILVSSENCPVRLYISIVLSYYYEQYNYSESLIPELIKFRDELYEYYKDHYADERIPKNSELYKEIYIKCHRRFPNSNRDPVDMLKPSGLDPVRLGVGEKNYYIMFDRDYDEERRNRDEYIKVINELTKKLFKPLVTTPQFELWLLMHFEDASFDGIKYNTYSGSIVSRLAERDTYEYGENKKRIKEDRFDAFYRDSIQTAIDTSLDSERFSTEPIDLESKVGTNLGLFIRDVLGFKNS